MKAKHGGNVYEINRNRKIPIDQLLDFSANINPLGLSEKGRQTLMEAIDGLAHYPDPDYVELREAIGKHHGVPADWVTPGNGAIESIFTAIDAVAPKTVLILAPTFVEYERAAQRIGASVRWFVLGETEDFQIHLDALLSAITQDIDLVVLCNPNNPTGTLTGKDQIEQILLHCKRQGAALLVDEAFMEFAELTDDQSVIPLLGEQEPLLITRSLTKFFAVPGLRSGWVLTGYKPWLQRMESRAIPWNINYLADRLTRYVLSDAAYVQETRLWLEGARSHLYQALLKMEGVQVYPSLGNYLFFRLEKSLDLKAQLLSKGIMIRSCDNYHGLDDRYYRVAVRTNAENDQLIAALSEILEQGCEDG